MLELGGAHFKESDGAPQGGGGPDLKELQGRLTQSFKDMGNVRAVVCSSFTTSSSHTMAPT